MTATPYRVPVLRAGGLSVRVRPRAVAATLGLVAAAVVLGALAMTLGTTSSRSVRWSVR